MTETEVLVEVGTGRVIAYHVVDEYGCDTWVTPENIGIIRYTGVEPVFITDGKGELYIKSGTFMLRNGINSLKDDFDGYDEED